MAETGFTFDGMSVTARPGQSLAAALTEAGCRTFRRTARDAPRGIFCGMGVCQDCLVTIDGVPNHRACMTEVTDGLEVETQLPFPALDPRSEPPAALPARVVAPDVLVIGGGAAGLSAAITARGAGAEVVLVDERRVSGGQYYKQTAAGEILDAQQAEGAALIAEAAASGAEIIGEVEIWGAFDGPLFLAEVNGGALALRPRTVIVATGAYERPCMVPGWTLPGVMTTGAAQILWRSHRTLAGKRVVLCGSGPLNLQVALELAEGGADVALVTETAPTPFLNPLTAARMALADPRLTWKGISTIHQLWRRGVPMRNATHIEAIESKDDALRATFVSNQNELLAVDTDVVCMNAGFEPQNEILRLLGADVTYDPRFGHLRCDRSETLETSVPSVFAVGDCAGLGGAPVARLEGRIAGRAAASRAGHGDGDGSKADLAALRRHQRFQRYLWKLHDVAPQSLSATPPETILCRCEEVTLGDAIASYEENPGHVGTLKRGTRIGMGACQGRYCGPAAARLIAERSGVKLTDRSFFAPRPPIKPVSIAAIIAALSCRSG